MRRFSCSRVGLSRFVAMARLGGNLPAYPFGSVAAATRQGDTPLLLSFGRRQQQGAAALLPASSRRVGGANGVAQRPFPSPPPPP